MAGGVLRPEKIIGCSEGMLAIERMIDQIAGSSATILITGESGTGKELIAHEIHHRSGQAQRPFVAVDCGALCCQILESELFGHVRGAFTGALADKPGLVEQASGGTLFLDEIGNLELGPQGKLLRFLECGEYRPLGGVQLRRADVRVVAATNRDVRAEVLEGRFREDLYYRLNQFEIHLPPLRDRRSDIPLLARHFLQVYAHKAKRNCREIEPETMGALIRYEWPGNIRELAHVIQYMTLMSGRSTLGYDCLPHTIRERQDAQNPLSSMSSYREARNAALLHFNRAFLEGALLASGGQVTLAARLSGLCRQTFHDLLRRYHVCPHANKNTSSLVRRNRIPDDPSVSPEEPPQRQKKKGMPDLIPFRNDGIRTAARTAV